MNTRTLVALILILLLAGIAYYVATERGKSGIDELGQEIQQDQMTQLAGEEPLLGMWRSTEDANFSREFRTDGTVIDMYQGDQEATLHGQWVRDDATPEGIPAEFPLVRIMFPDTEPMYFGVAVATDSDLQLVNYSGRGNILLFTKVQE